MIQVLIAINPDPDGRCGMCPYLSHSSTGLVGEYHPTCTLFFRHGEWGRRNMKRVGECIDAEALALRMM